MKRYRIGPDEIIIQLEGNTLLSRVADAVDYCGLYEVNRFIPST